ncbi:MAG: hypothetical protein IT384_29555 [Deltaproteobacteria bacterium]|nr:hypothetical protein [Deltaproteobacteria bacterium]
MILLALAVSPRGVLGQSTDARARAAPLELVYEPSPALDDCGSAEALRDEVSARLGYVPWSSAPGLRRARARIFGRPGGVSGEVALEDRAGHPVGRRSLGPHATCAEVMSEMALAIAIAIDPLSAGGPAPPPRSQSPSQSQSPEAAPPEPIAETPARAPAPSASRAWRIGGAMSISMNSAPAVAAGALVFGELELGMFAFGVEGRADLPASTPAAGGSVSSSLLLASATGCLRVGIGAGCVVASAGALRASSDGLAEGRKRSSGYATAGVRGRIDVPLAGAFAIRGQLDLAAVLTQIEVVDARTQAPFWTTPDLTVAFAIGPVITLE